VVNATNYLQRILWILPKKMHKIIFNLTKSLAVFYYGIIGRDTLLSLEKKGIYESKECNQLITSLKNGMNFYKGDDDNNKGAFLYLKKILGNCQIMFDVGANVGIYTKFALKVNKNLQIHCFEPVKETYEILVANNFPPNVVTNNIALSSSIGEKEIIGYMDDLGLSSFYVRRGLEISGKNSQSPKEIVPTTTLDEYCSEKQIDHLDFLKVDVEGHELEVFKGGLSLLREGKIELIQFEYGGCNIDARVFLMDLFDFFMELNYDLFKIYPDHIKLIKNYDQNL
jgi:FkbM family methyltransferase